MIVALAEVLMTILHPEARGPVTGRIEQGIWRLIGVASRLLGDRVYRLAGPAAVAAGVGWWVLALWVGFGLIWLAASSSIVAPSSGLFDPDFGFADALYFSGVSLTTVGFGDLVGGTTSARLVSVVEAGAGLIVLTSSITYVLSVYPLVAQKRANAVRVRDLRADEPTGAARLSFELGTDELQRLHGDLISLGENLRRFPVLYYFHASRYEEEMTPLLRAALLAVVCLDLAEPGEAHSKRSYREPLARACERFISDLRNAFDVEEGPQPQRSEIADGLSRLHERARERWADQVSAEPPGDATIEFIERGERFLSGLAEEHGYGFEPLLGSSG